MPRTASPLWIWPGNESPIGILLDMILQYSRGEIGALLPEPLHRITQFLKLPIFFQFQPRARAVDVLRR